jgi:hypothetical protein
MPNDHHGLGWCKYFFACWSARDNGGAVGVQSSLKKTRTDFKNSRKSSVIQVGILKIFKTIREVSKAAQYKSKLTGSGSK